MPAVIKSHCKLIANDTKLYKEIHVPGLKDYEDFQGDIYEVCKWTVKWMLFFNADKCEVLHIHVDNNNPRYSYKMTDKNNNTVDIKDADH